MTPAKIKVCVVTSLAAAQEPRAPRHAATLARMPGVSEVVFVDMAAHGAERQSVKALEDLPNLTWRTHRFATRAGNMFQLLWQRVWQRLARLKFTCGGQVSPVALSTRVFGLEKVLADAAADVYLAHNIETLLPAYFVAQRRGARVMFDSMEFHSDMGDSQTPLERRMTAWVERSCLPGCALVLASSAQVADALASEYGIARPLALDNAAPLELELPSKAAGFHLYWRNAVVGLGHRGLDDALVALTKLPDAVTLHLQGRLQFDGGMALRERISTLGLANRVVIHPPFSPENAVQEAAVHHLGLCLERKGVRNHDLTTSNKIFDYHMAGLSVIASDLLGLRGVIERSGGGLLFMPGDVEDLTAKILMLYHDASRLKLLSEAARAFALREGNREAEMKKFTAAFVKVCPRKN